ncbi:hypothetical protein HY988_01590 [Candidatus Micrarchaeota archaeon]|nr:hypothetical protein [Candidatus Micrarchaeota archaeon]
MDESIEICAGCGKMPRMVDKMSGDFTCPRCGGKQTMLVNADNYEKTATELDQRFHQGMMQKNIDEVSTEPLKIKVIKTKKPGSKAGKTKKSSPKTASKKPAKSKKKK